MAYLVPEYLPALLLILPLLFTSTQLTQAAEEIIENSGESSGEQPQTPLLEAVVETLSTQPIAEKTIENETEGCLPKVDIAFVLDTSGNFEKIYQEHVKWTVELVQELPVRKDAVRIAALQYAGSPITEFSLGTYSSGDEIKEHLKKIAFQSGVTRTGYALRKAEAELFREDKGARLDAAKIIILFTDGLSIDDPQQPAHQLRNNKNVKIYVVSVGSAGFEPEMNKIAGMKGNVYGPRDLQLLKTALKSDIERSQNCPVSPTMPIPETTTNLPAENGESVFEATKTSERLNTNTVESTTATPFEKFADPTTEAPTGQANATADIIPTVNEADKTVKNNTESFAQENEVETTALPGEKTVPVDFENTTASAEEKETPGYVNEKTKTEEMIKEVTQGQTTAAPQVTKTENNSEKNTVEDEQNENGEAPVTQEIPKEVPKADSIDSKTEVANKPEEKSKQVPEIETTEKNVEIMTVTSKPSSKPIGISKKIQKDDEKLGSAKSSYTQVQHREQGPVTRPPYHPDDSVTKTTISRKLTTRKPMTPRPNIRTTDGKCPADVLFLLDSSGSVKSIYDHQKLYLNDILEEAQVAEHEHRIALIQFAGNTHQRTEWTFDTFDDKEDMMLAFSGVRHFTGTTYIGRALEEALKLLGSRRAYVPTVIVLLSDGFSQDDATVPADTIRRYPGIEFYAVSISDLSNTEYLETLTGDPSRVYIGDESEELKRYLIKLFHCEA